MKYRHDLDAIEGVLVARKRELAEKAGTDEVVTSVQYKLYANEMRMKLKTHRRMEIELEQIKAEESTLEQTVELLEKRFKSIKEENRAEGQAVIETLDLDEPSLRPRPKTAKPTTSDVDDLKLMIERLSAQIGEKRTEVQQLNTKVNEIEKVQKEENDTYMAAKNEFEQIEAMITGEVEELNKRKVELEKRLNVSTEELKTNKELIERQHWLFEQTKLSADQLLVVCQNLERHGTECQQQIQKVSGDISELSNRKDLAEQMQMWQKLLQIFETKLRLSRANDSSNAGVGTIAAPNDEQQRDIRPIGDKF